MGFGLTLATDRLLVERILGYRFDFLAAHREKEAANSRHLQSLFPHTLRNGPDGGVF